MYSQRPNIVLPKNYAREPPTPKQAPPNAAPWANDTMEFAAPVPRQIPSPQYAPVPMQVPEKDAKEVLLGASSPQTVRKGTEFTARFVAYTELQEGKVRRFLKKLNPRSQFLGGIKREHWQIGTEISVRCSGEHLAVDPPEDKFIWDGNRQIVDFDIRCSPAAPDAWTVLKFDALIDGIVVARLRIDIEISSHLSNGERVQVEVEPIRTAFASYASEDRLRVLDRVSEIQKNGVDVFVDCLSLNPGDEWKPRLEREIQSRKLFLLFWSANARDSDWVDWEWRTALKHKGITGIDPHPLDPVFVAAPPDELSELHFGDPYNLVRRAHEDK